MRIKRLGNICEINIGKTPFRKESKYWGKGYKWLSISDLNKKVITESKEEITLDAVNETNCKVVKKGTLMMSFKLSIGKLAFAGTDLFTNEAIAALPIKDQKEIFSEYLYYTLKYIPLIGSNKAAKGVTLNKKSLAQIKVPIPENYDDQIRIAKVLSKAEKLIKKRKENINRLDELLRSMFLEMFGDPVEMQKERMIQFGEIISFLTSGSRGWAKYYSENGKIFIRINNVKNASIDIDDVVYVTPPDSAEAIRTEVQTNDLLFSITADLGRTGVVSEELKGSFINQHLALIRLKEGVNPLYVAWFYEMPLGRYFVQKKNKNGVKSGLNFDDIKGFPIFLPPLSLQNKFAEIVEKVETIRKKYEKSLFELEELYNSLNQRAFKGKLNLDGIKIEKEEAASDKLEWLSNSMQQVLEEKSNVENTESVSSMQDVILYSKSLLKKENNATEIALNEFKNEGTNWWKVLGGGLLAAGAIFFGKKIYDSLKQEKEKDEEDSLIGRSGEIIDNTLPPEEVSEERVLIKPEFLSKYITVDDLRKTLEEVSGIYSFDILWENIEKVFYKSIPEDMSISYESEKEIYKHIRNLLFELLEKGDIKQVFDENDKEIKLEFPE